MNYDQLNTKDGGNVEAFKWKTEDREASYDQGSDRDPEVDEIGGQTDVDGRR